MSQYNQTFGQKKEPLISYIIPVYNLPWEMVRECLNGLLSLSLSRDEREIILVDDGSETSYVNEVTALCEDIIYIRQKNRGLSVARNTGIRMATGKYIEFIDGDDHLIRTPYEHCLDIVRYHDPDLVTFDFTSDDSAKTETPFSFDGPISGSSYMHGQNIKASVCGYIFKRKILMDLRFIPGIYHEDEDFTPQLLLRADRIFTTNAVAYFYRKQPNSITNTKDKRHYLRRLQDTESVIYHLNDIAEKLPEKDRVALQRRIAQLTMDYLYNTIILTHSGKFLDRVIDRLSRKGLFPLPDKNYTKKYRIFRTMINSETGRKIMLMTLTNL